LHVTTRQDFQLHYVHIDDTPDLMRRLAAVGVTTREACGNSVRNITGCPLAGVCRGEAFDVSPYADALTWFLLGHDDVQDFGRKFKTAFSGCEGEACALVMMHDLGFVARIRQVDGQPKRGFAMFVGGGLGTVPHQAKLLDEFVPEEEILPLAQAVARVFARLGEKRNRNRARIKFLVADLGIEEFRRLVFAERATLPHDPRWTAYLARLDGARAAPLRPAGSPVGDPGDGHAATGGAVPATNGRGVAIHLDGWHNGHDTSGGLGAWLASNVYPQRQAGYAVATVNLPLGDLSSDQARALADIARRFAGDDLRTTVEQNIVLRWVPEADLHALHRELHAIGLGDPGAGTIVDITSCPGTDTCKLGIASSRGLAGELRTQLAARSASLPDAVKELRVKISGCFNSCGQHHVADIGFFGNSRRRDNRTVPHFQVVLGGQWQENAGSFGLAVGAVPSKLVPQVLDALVGRFAAERERDESFQGWVTRRGKAEIRAILAPFMEVPAYGHDPSLYSDWNDPREFTLGDIGVGECAGEVVSLFALEISKAEGRAFDALQALDDREFAAADLRAYQAMLLAARALLLGQTADVGDDPSRIVAGFRTRFHDTGLFHDPYAGGKFAHYLLRRHEAGQRLDADGARQTVEEANLFIEAAHACDLRIAQRAALPKEIS
jgi:sulfite reductase (ferredoxin)